MIVDATGKILIIGCSIAIVAIITFVVWALHHGSIQDQCIEWSGVHRSDAFLKTNLDNLNGSRYLHCMYLNGYDEFPKPVVKPKPLWEAQLPKE